MPTFPSKSSPLNHALRRYPALVGIPFLLIIVGASFGLQSFTHVRYDLQDQKITQVLLWRLIHDDARLFYDTEVTKEEALGLNKNRKRIDIREEYFRLSSPPGEDWEPKRIPRPKGVPEWGVPPTESPLAKPPKE